MADNENTFLSAYTDYWPIHKCISNKSLYTHIYTNKYIYVRYVQVYVKPVILQLLLEALEKK